MDRLQNSRRFKREVLARITAPFAFTSAYASFIIAFFTIGYATLFIHSFFKYETGTVVKAFNKSVSTFMSDFSTLVKVWLIMTILAIIVFIITAPIFSFIGKKIRSLFPNAVSSTIGTQMALGILTFITLWQGWLIFKNFEIFLDFKFASYMLFLAIIFAQIYGSIIAGKAYARFSPKADQNMAPALQ